jgi:hypothetical protein
VTTSQLINDRESFVKEKAPPALAIRLNAVP